MDFQSAITTAIAIGTGLGGFAGGKLSSRNSASQIAADTVDMLQAQVDILKQDKEHRELEILDLTQRVAVLEGLVTQRAEVEELTVKVSLVKETVERIAMKIGT